MLETLRNAANSWVLKPLLLLLVVAFVVWGIADVFTAFRGGALATVGKTEISEAEYQRTYGMVMDNFTRRFGRRPTADEARLRGIDRAVLEDMINSAAVDNHARELGLALPQKAIVAQIEKDPSFQDAGGRFNRAAFDNFLRETGYNERGWLVFKRNEELRQQLTQPMLQDLPVSATLANLVHQFREETRTVQFFTIDPGKVVKLGEPDEAQLKEVFGAQGRRFVTPEFRKLGVLLLTGADVKARMAISDEEARKIYDGDTAAQTIPERRRIQQIPFDDMASAEVAAKAIKGGKKFEEVAKERGASDSDIDLGIVTKAEMIDQKVAEAAFALAADKVSDPVQGRFKVMLVRATEILPGRTRSFDELKQEIKDKVAGSRINEEMRKLHDSVDDGRSAGKPLKDIAASIGATAKYVEIAETDSRNRKPDGSPAYDGADAAALVQSGFEGKVGVESEPVDLADGGMGWVDVLSVTVERQRPFEEVKDDVKAVWKEQETAKQLSELAAKLVERAGKGETLTKLTAESGGKLETSRPFKRVGDDAGLPMPLIQRAFGLQLGATASTETADRKSRTVFRLVEIKKPDAAGKEATERTIAQLRQERQQDVVQAYVTALRERFGVSINEAIWKRTTGAGGDAR